MMGNRRTIAAVASFLVLVASAARAADKADVDRAVAKGVEHLKVSQQADGSWRHTESGATSLAALALLECDVKADDDVIKKAADFVRTATPKMTQTYSIALAILFFDRLGDPADIPLIESLMVRLMAGQSFDGGWSYTCPELSNEEVTRLTEFLGKRNELRGGLTLPKPGQKKKPTELPKEIQGQLTQVLRQGNMGFPGGMMMRGNSDNSNTQFATVAMWVGRKHGLPVDGALGRLDAKFRRSQAPNGTWGYLDLPQVPPGIVIPPDVQAPRTSTQMTCSGILALTVAHGVTNDPENRGRGTDPARDPILQKGLTVLEAAIGSTGQEVPRLGPDQGLAYYCLWSIERCCVALNLEKVGNKDWYNWGADILLANQGGQGAWAGEHAGCGADTAFALLFLRRSNLTHDLSANLKARTKAITIRGGTGLKGVKPALTPEKKFEDPRPKDTPRMKPLPDPSAIKEVTKLSDELIRARGAERATVFKKLLETRGPQYTEALAIAIPQLAGEDKKTARDSLQLRLQRFTAKTLSEYTADADPEIRAAAILAAAGKNLRDLVPLFIDRIGDSDLYVVNAARSALKHLTKEDFGPQAGATPEERAAALTQWKEWLKKNGTK